MSYTEKAYGGQTMKLSKTIFKAALVFAVAGSMTMPVQAKTRVRLNRTKLSAIQGKKYSLYLKGTRKKAKWSTTKKSVVKVTSKGKLTVIKPGVAYIKAKVNKRTYKCRVKVLTPVLSLKKTTMVIGSKKTLKIKYNAKKVKWTSSNPAVASVSKGKVTAIATGSATIKAKAGSKTLSCKVTVPQVSLAVSSLTITQGETATLSLKNKGTTTATFTSLNPAVATVDANGIVTGVAPGTTQIQVAVNNKTLTCNVTVNAPDTQTETPAVTQSGNKAPMASSSTSSDPNVTPATNDARTTTRTTYTSGVVGQCVKASVKLGKGSYSSSDDSIALVSKSGLVMPLKAGDVTIYNDSTGDSLDMTITDPGNAKIGVDVSYHNGNVDFNALKAAGVDYAIIRGGNTLSKLKTTNSDGIDLNCKTNIDKAEAAGMDYGIYWYMNSSDNKGLMTVEEAQDQAEMLASYLQGYKTSHFTLPIYLDLEQKSALLSGDTKADKADYQQGLCEAFSAKLAEYGFANVGIYSSTSWYNNYLANEYFMSSFTSRWLAHYGYNSVSGTKLGGYTAVPSITYQGQTYYPDLWQTGSDFKIDGISGYVDMNYKYD